MTPMKVEGEDHLHRAKPAAGVHPTNGNCSFGKNQPTAVRATQLGPWFAALTLDAVSVSSYRARPVESAAVFAEIRKIFGRVVEFLEGTVVGSLQRQVRQIKLLMSRANVRDGPYRLEE